MRSLFLFSDGESLLHRVDPRPKFLLVIAVLFYILLFNEPLYMLAAVVAVILAIWVFARIPIWDYWGLVVLFTPLILGVGLIQAFLYHPPGSVAVARFGPLAMSNVGLLLGLSIGLRLTTMGITFMMFAMTTTPRDVGLALYKTGIPFRFAYLASFGLRFLPLMQDNLQTIQDARATRGDPDVGSRNPLRRIKSLPVSLFPLAANSLRQSNETAIALELRGYGVSQNRTTVDDIDIEGVDYVVMAAAAALVVGVLYARIVLGVGVLSF